MNFKETFFFVYSNIWLDIVSIITIDDVEQKLIQMGKDKA